MYPVLKRFDLRHNSKKGSEFSVLLVVHGAPGRCQRSPSTPRESAKASKKANRPWNKVTSKKAPELASSPASGSKFAILRLGISRLWSFLTRTKFRNCPSTSERSIDLKCFGDKAGPPRRADCPVGTPKGQVSSIRLSAPAGM